MFNQISLFLAQNNLLDNNQSGFRSGHSTETALLSVTEALRLARAASKSSVLLLLDLSAAFDTVNRQILLSTLRKMGISGTCPTVVRVLPSQIGPSGCLGGVRFRSHNFLLLEFLKAQCLDHFSSPFICRH